MARIIGVDLGSHTVKLAVMTGAFGRFEVEEYLAEAVPQGDRSLPDRLACLESLLAGIPDDDRLTAAAAFPTERASVRMIALPFADKGQIQQTLGFEVEGQVPFDLEDMALNHRLLDANAEGSRVLAALVARDRVGPLLAGLSEVGADPKSLVIDGDVLGDFASQGVEAVVDIGHQRTLVTICNDGHVWGTRAINFGGSQLTQALADAHNIDLEEAEALKHRTSLSSTFDAEAEWEEEDVTQATEPKEEAPPVHARSARDSEVLRTAIQPLLASLRATLISFEDSLELEIDNVLLCGGTANLSGLTRVLKVDLGVGVRRLAVSDIAHAAGQPARLALCHALARRAAGISNGEEMELRSGEFKFHGDLASFRNLIIGGGISLVAIMLLGIGTVAWKVMNYNEQLSDLDDQIAEVVVQIHNGELDPESITGAEDALTKLQLKTLETTLRIETLGAVVAESPPVLSTLHDLTLAMPQPEQARIDVRELTITTKSVNLEADTDTYDSASTIEASIQQHERFRQATKGDDKKVRDGIRFSITVPLNIDEMPSEEG